MQSLYSNEVREYVHTRDWPKTLQIDVVEAYEPGPHLKFVFYYDNWMTFSAEDQIKISGIVSEVMTKLRHDGIPCYMGRMEGARRG